LYTKEKLFSLYILFLINFNMILNKLNLFFNILMNSIILKGYINLFNLKNI
jgi:hypothetical protein